MNHAIPHDLELSVAKRVARDALDGYKARFAKYEPEVAWSDDAHARISFKAKGFAVTGTVAVGARSIDLDLDVPILLRPLRSRAVELIDREVTAWLASAKG